MSSSLIVEVLPIEEIQTHPNADRLELARIKGWWCAVPKDQYKVNDIVVYIPPDAVLPVELSDKIGVTKYLSHGRVKTSKLRGSYSQGIIVSPETLQISNYKIGEDVQELLGITKYEPPFLPSTMGGIEIRCPSSFVQYTDIEHYKNYPNVLTSGEEVVITEKIHGSSWRGSNINNVLYVGSHRRALQEDDSILYWKAAKLYDLKSILPNNSVFFGEVFGKGVQKLHYDRKGIDIAFYDMIVDGRYVNFNELGYFLTHNNLPSVPILFIGEWDTSLLTYATGKSAIAKHIKEGIVVKPVVERFNLTIGRVILKYISESYLLKSYGDLH
jgi:RNA ligase (TIGR02306 family)